MATSSSDERAPRAAAPEATLRRVLRLALVLALIPACASTTSSTPSTSSLARSSPSSASPAPSSSSAPSPPAAPVDPVSAPPAAPAPPPPLGPIERAVLGGVESNATVRAMCAASAAQGGPCLVYVDMPGEGTCPPGLALVHPCLWTVAVASNMGTHASRRATMLVRPDGVVVAAANLFCPPMAPAAWEGVERASLAGTPVDDCPPAVADAPGTPSTSR